MEAVVLTRDQTSSMIEGTIVQVQERWKVIYQNRPIFTNKHIITCNKVKYSILQSW